MIRTAISQETLPERARSSRIVKFGYSFGNVGKSIVWTSFETFMLYYLTTLAGLAPLLAGSVLAAAMFGDACADVTVAYLADRRGRTDSLRSLILYGAPLCGVSFWLIFVVPSGGWHWPIVAAIILCRVGYTLCDIGHNTLLVRVASTPRDAASVSGIRFLCSAIGIGIVGLASSHALAIGDILQQRSALSTYAAIGGAIYIATLMIAMWVTWQVPPPPGKGHPARSTAAFLSLWRHRPYRRVLYLIAIQACLIPMFMRALPFFGEAMHRDAGWAGSALLVITVAQALALPGWIALSRWRSAETAMVLAHVVMMIAITILAIGSDTVPDIVALSLLGAAQAGMAMAIWALLAVSVRDGVALGLAAEALPIGLFLATLKTAAGVGNALLASAIAVQGRACASCTTVGWAEGHSLIFAAIGLPLLGCAATIFVVSRKDAPRSQSV